MYISRRRMTRLDNPRTPPPSGVVSPISPGVWERRPTEAQHAQPQFSLGLMVVTCGYSWPGVCLTPNGIHGRDSVGTSTNTKFQAEKDISSIPTEKKEAPRILEITSYRFAAFPEFAVSSCDHISHHLSFHDSNEQPFTISYVRQG